MSEHGIPFFNDVPTAAIPATQKLWDAIDVPGYNALVAYNIFVSDLQASGIEAPPRTAVRRWAAGVEAGLIDRPITGENKLRVKKTVATPAAVSDESEPSSETTTLKAIEVAPKERKSGTLKLRRQLSDNEVTALKAIKEMRTADVVLESPDCKHFSVAGDIRADEVSEIWSDAQAPIEDGSTAAEYLADRCFMVSDDVDFNEVCRVMDECRHTGDGTLLPEDDLKSSTEADNHSHEISADPVQDAVDIIVKHYEEQEFAKARTVAAAKAAAALREFANRIEASA